MSGRPLTTASPGTSYRRQGHIYGDPTNASVKGGYGDLSDLTSPLPAMPRGPPRTPSPNTPYRWQDYINVDWTNDPVSQAIRAAIAATPHGDLNDLPSSDSGTENGMITPRSISPDRRINARPPMRIDPVPTASSGLSHQSTHSTSQETHQTTRPNQRQSRNPATRQYRRPLTRSRHTSRLVSLSYDSPKSLNGYRGGREVQITSDELLQQMAHECTKTPTRSRPPANSRPRTSGRVEKRRSAPRKSRSRRGRMDDGVRLFPLDHADPSQA